MSGSPSPRCGLECSRCGLEGSRSASADRERVLSRHAVLELEGSVEVVVVERLQDLGV